MKRISMRRMLKIEVRSLSLVVFFIFSISCASEKVDMGPEGNPMPAKAIDEVLREHAKSLMSIPGVVGTAQGLCDDKPCIKVYVIEETPELEGKIPQIIGGYPVMIEETGEIRALPKSK
jgi:hypothetical protein